MGLTERKKQEKAQAELMEGILSCPFCGSHNVHAEEVRDTEDKYHGWTIQCSDCFAVLPEPHDEILDAVAKWNTRSSDTVEEVTEISDEKIEELFAIIDPSLFAKGTQRGTMPLVELKHKTRTWLSSLPRPQQTEEIVKQVEAALDEIAEENNAGPIMSLASDAVLQILRGGKI